MHCDCTRYPDMHDSSGVCVNWENHGDAPCEPTGASGTRYTLYLRNDNNTASIRGIEGPNAKIVKRTGGGDGIVVLKRPGFKYAFSNHPKLDGYGYSPAEYWVMALTSAAERHGLLDIVEARKVASFPVRS